LIAVNACVAPGEDDTPPASLLLKPTKPNNYWENFTPLVTNGAEGTFENIGGGTQFFKKHVPVPTLGSKFHA
jgi:hypothetical protein